MRSVPDYEEEENSNLSVSDVIKRFEETIQKSIKVISKDTKERVPVRHTNVFTGNYQLPNEATIETKECYKIPSLPSVKKLATKFRHKCI